MEKNFDFTSNNDDLDITYILRFFLRNKKFIGITSSLFFLIACIFSFFIKKTWEGNFEIVLEKQNNMNSLADSKFQDIINLGGFDINSGQKNINTEVGILSSPLILFPVLDYAENLKSKKLDFDRWKRNLQINLVKKTSILNINYRDKDKEDIVPILKKISNQYQEYSGKNKKRSQELSNKFFKEQIEIFKKKSSDSLRAAQQYALDQDLVIYDYGIANQNIINNNSNNLRSIDILQKTNFLLPNTNTRIDNSFPNTGIENTRVQAANQIRKINVQLQKIQELNDSEELKYYIGSTIPALVDEGLPEALSNIEADLSKARSIYTENDIEIVNLVKKRNLVMDLLKNRTIKYLEVQKLDSEATLKATMRPKGVLLKYKELIREAARDEQTLIELEEKFNLFKLDLATQEDPWELITEPTLIQSPVAPSKKNVALQGLFIGFILSSFYSIVREKKSGIAYDEKELENILSVPVIAELNKDIFDDIKLKILFKNNLDKEICLLSLGNLENEKLDVIKKQLSMYLPKKNVLFLNDILDLDKNKLNIILNPIGTIKTKDINDLKKISSLYDIKIAGLISIKN